ncbi:hypothetical protein [Bradyrhizobium sp. RDM4]|uniref:hypothetical protein n=1 Tax=Bradyrhizobium sp. RDM4 TaxID=3378765 RepID=UPI0038FCD02B
MSCTAEDFPDLLPAAASEIARQLNAGAPDAAALTPTGFGWSLALEVQRQQIGGGNAGMLFKLGLPARTAKAIAAACDEVVQRREAARVAEVKLGVNLATKFRRRSYCVPDPSWN